MTTRTDKELLELCKKAFDAIPIAAKARRVLVEEFEGDAPAYSGNRSHVLARAMAEIISKHLETS